MRKWSDDSETEEEVSDIANEIQAGHKKDKESEEYNEDQEDFGSEHESEED